MNGAWKVDMQTIMKPARRALIVGSIVESVGAGLLAVGCFCDKWPFERN
jgi:hypothetical protein